MISARNPLCRSFETGLVVAKVREESELPPARTAGRDERDNAGTTVVADFSSNTGDVFYDEKNRYARGRMQTYAGYPKMNRPYFYTGAS